MNSKMPTPAVPKDPRLSLWTEQLHGDEPCTLRSSLPSAFFECHVLSCVVWMAYSLIIHLIMDDTQFTLTLWSVHGWVAWSLG